MKYEYKMVSLCFYIAGPTIAYIEILNKNNWINNNIPTQYALITISYYLLLNIISQ